MLVAVEFECLEDGFPGGNPNWTRTKETVKTRFFFFVKFTLFEHPELIKFVVRKKKKLIPVQYTESSDFLKFYGIRLRVEDTHTHTLGRRVAVSQKLHVRNGFFSSPPPLPLAIVPA